MSLYFETLCVEQGKVLRLAYHQARLNRTLQALKTKTVAIDLQEFFAKKNMVAYTNRCRCRIDYTAVGISNCLFAAYTPRQVRSLRLLETDIHYTFKAQDRNALDALFAQRGTADDVLLVKEGLLTDTTIANIALEIGGQWYTPEKPLLCGTHRAALVDKGILLPAPLSVDDLRCATNIRLLNAMLRWGEMENITVEGL